MEERKYGLNKPENYQTIAVYGLYLDTNLKFYILYISYIHIP